MENECESGKGGECYLLFQRFFCEKQYNSSGYELGLDETVWDQILALQFISFVTLGKLLKLLSTSVSHLENEKNNSTCLGVVVRIQLIHIKLLEDCQIKKLFKKY